MSDVDGPGRCNRCGEPLQEETPVRRAFSGRWPYEHSQPEDCPALRGSSTDQQGVPRPAEE
jgi:hypothetical protein